VIDLAPGCAALLAALPFGRCDAAQLRRAAAWAEDHGSGEVRPSLTRGLLLPGLAAEMARTLAAEAGAAGFIVDPADPRLRASACPGAPACAAASTPAPRDAAALAQAARALLATGASLHVSACPKGCAHPAPASLTLVGGEDGRYGVVLGGPAGVDPVARLPLSEIMTRLTHAPALPDLDAAFREGSR
jgi:precorrin-3B synthase